VPRIRDRALVLRRFAFGESSLVLHALTRDHGRVHLIAKGAYRPKVRFHGVLDLFDTLDLEWSAAPGRELSPLRAGEILERRRLDDDLERYEAGLCVLELLGLSAREGAPTPRLFDVATRALDELGGRELPACAALVVFELGFLQNLGLAPALVRCAACGAGASAVAASGDEPRGAFSAGAGGRLCRSCADEARASGRRVGTLPVAVLESAAALAAVAGPEPADVPDLTASELDRVRDVVARFLEYHLETRPNSYRAFLAAPQRNAPRRVARTSR